MVDFWDAELERAIKLTKSRIAHCEKHGMGKNAMDEKKILQKQQRKQELRKQK